MNTARILIVDDDKDTCDNLADLLTDRGHQSDSACDGAGAWQVAQQAEYRLALVDYRLPDTDGIALFGRIHSRSPGTAGILMTSDAAADMAPAAHQAGFRRLLMKPLDVAELLSLIEEILHDKPS